MYGTVSQRAWQQLQSESNKMRSCHKLCHDFVTFAMTVKPMSTWWILLKILELRREYKKYNKLMIYNTKKESC